MSIEAMKQALEALESATPKYTRQRADQKTLGGALDYWKLEQHQRLKAITSLRQAIAEAEKQDHWTHHGAGGNVPLPKGTGHLHTCLGMPKAEKQEPVAVIGSGFQLLWCRQDWSKGLKVGDCLYTHPQPKREPPTPLEVKDVLRATGLLTNSQAWDVAEAEKQEPYGWVSQHTTKGVYEWQFNKEISGVYPDTAISILPVYTHPQPKREPMTDEQIEREWQFAHDEEDNIDHHDFARAIEAAHGVTSDMKQEHVDKTAKQRHEENT